MDFLTDSYRVTATLITLFVLFSATYFMGRRAWDDYKDSGDHSLPLLIMFMLLLGTSLFQLAEALQ